MESIKSEAASLTKRLQNSEKKVSCSSEDVKEQYLSPIQGSLRACEQLQKVLSSTEDRRQDLADYLCEDASSFSLDDLFGTIKTFRGLFLRALKENESRRELEKKRKKREEENKLKGEPTNKIIRREVNPKDEGCIIDNLMAEIRRGYSLKKTRPRSQRGSRRQLRPGTIRRSKAVDESSVPGQSLKTSGMALIEEAPPTHPGDSSQSQQPSEAVQTPAASPTDSSGSGQSVKTPEAPQAPPASPSTTRPETEPAEPTTDPAESPDHQQQPSTTAEETHREVQVSAADSGSDSEGPSDTALEGVQLSSEHPEPKEDLDVSNVTDGSDFEYITSAEVRGIKPENGNAPNRSSKQPSVRSAGLHDCIRSQSPKKKKKKKSCVVQ
uniref:FH2 domain-containing protein n=1 Tax=Fundulus heteroclitus TaxID=8078 RepID=A0A3Q2PCX5_FUNHE